MDYNELAKELMQKMLRLQRVRRQNNMVGSVHGEAFVLYYIRHNKGHALPGEISDAMNISTARIAAALNSLERKGLITRETDRGDRRRIIVSLTPEGEKHSAEQEKAFINMIKRMLISLGEEDAKEYVRITGKLADAFKEKG